MTWMYVEKKLELALLVWCRLYVAGNLYDISRRYSFPHCPVERLFYLISLINPFAASTFCTDNLILMISGVNALSLGLLGNVVCDRFRLAWFVTQAP